MAKIIMFGNQKGGVGKSLCTVIAATTYAQAPFNLRVTVADVDPQKSIMSARKYDQRRYDMSAPFNVVACSVSDFQRQAQQLDDDNDLVFIDAAGKLDADLPVKQQQISKTLMYVDYLFIPFVAGAFNFEASYNYLLFVQKIQQIRAGSGRPLQVFGFVNMFRQRSVRDRYLSDDLTELKKRAGLQVMKTVLNHYALFSDADTFESLYTPDTFDTAKLNVLAWLNEISKICKIK